MHEVNTGNSGPKVGESGLSDEQFVRQKYPDAEEAIAGAIYTESCDFGFEMIGFSWADARARIEAKPEPLPNTLQEEQFQQWLKTSGYKSESATCIFLMHQAWKAAAPKVVDYKEEQCLAKQLELSIPGATSGTLIIIKAAVDVELKKRFPDAETFKPKVGEQDGEQELPRRPRAFVLLQIHPTWLYMAAPEVEAYISVLEAENKLLKAESVAPPSLPTQGFETWWNQYGRNERRRVDACCAAWNASRAAAPVALSTHQLVSSSCAAAGDHATWRCSCGRTFVGVGDGALARARASFEAHLPEKEGK